MKEETFVNKKILYKSGMILSMLAIYTVFIGSYRTYQRIGGNCIFVAFLYCKEKRNTKGSIEKEFSHFVLVRRIYRCKLDTVV